MLDSVALITVIIVLLLVVYGAIAVWAIPYEIAIPAACRIDRSDPRVQQPYGVGHRRSTNPCADEKLDELHCLTVEGKLRLRREAKANLSGHCWHSGAAPSLHPAFKGRELKTLKSEGEPCEILQHSYW
ncbi:MULTISPECIES: hypothetical protein [unclassified Mesorhizobium]|nr:MULTISPECIES: hypothetical protein [unclassified Mesorhizobium]